MRFLARILTVAGLCAPAVRAEGAAPAMASAAIERIALPAALVAGVRVDALSREVILSAARDPAALLQALRGKSRLCPAAERDGDEVVLHCSTRKLDAALADGGRALDLRELRGLPFRAAADAPPLFFYDPVALGLGAACPGDTSASRAECALAQGDLALAERQLTLELAGPFPSYAALRLGDVLLLRNDVEGALAFYQAAGAASAYGQLAVQRRHELLGLPPSSLVLDRSRVPEPLATELDLREARALAFAGDDAQAAGKLAARLADPKRPPACASAELLCRRLAFAALGAESSAARALGLSLFVALDGRAQGALAAPLARAAADVSAELGAPLFGANALAAVRLAVAPAHLEEHLLRTAELYAAAGDAAREGVILQYAQLHVAMKDPRWAPLVAPRAAAAGQGKPAAKAPPPELEQAAALLSRSRAVHPERSNP